MRMPRLPRKTSIAVLFLLGAVVALPSSAGAPGGEPGVGFWTITPCRLVDTWSGPSLGAGVHTFQVSGLRSGAGGWLG